MQFLPATEVGELSSRGTQSDITFCHFTEPDPLEWDDKYVGIIEEYVSFFGEKELINAGETRAQIHGIMLGLGRKYNNAQLMTDILEAQVSLVPSASQAEPVTEEERRISDQAADPSVGCFMARLRLFSLEAIKQKDIPAYEMKRALWLQNYTRIKYIFEKRTVKILSPAVFLCIAPDYSQMNTSMKVITEVASDKLSHMYRDLHYVNVSPETGCQKLPFLQRWLADDTKLTFNTCAFDPRCIIPNNFNTFFGFRAASLPPVINLPKANLQLNLVLKHIKDVFCNGVDENAEFVFKWMANIIQYPWKKTEVLILIFGVEGCGKGLIIDFFANKVLGQHISFQTATPGVDLFSKFAVGAYRKLFCFCDEAGEDLSKHHDELKNLITTKTLRAEKKGQDVRTENNFINVIVVSNNAGPVRISPHDRRVVAFECSDMRKQDYKYFSDLASAVDSDECAKEMYNFLLGYHVPPDYNFQEHRPVTKYYESLQAASLPIFYRFLSYKCVTDGSESSSLKVQARTFFTEFITWKNDRNYENAYTESRFGRDIHALVENENSGVKRIKRSSMCYEIRFDILRTYLIMKKRFDENAF